MSWRAELLMQNCRAGGKDAQIMCEHSVGVQGPLSLPQRVLEMHLWGCFVMSGEPAWRNPARGRANHAAPITQLDCSAARACDFGMLPTLPRHHLGTRHVAISQ